MHNPDYDIDIPSELINLHYSVWRLEALLTKLINKCIDTGVSISADDILAASAFALDKVQAKFPEREIFVRDNIVIDQ